MTQEALDKAFPHGVVVAQEGEVPNFELVELEVDEEDGKTFIFGWAYPNKDMWFWPEDVMLNADGDWVFHSEGKRFRFSNLSEEKSKQVKSMMEEV